MAPWGRNMEGTLQERATRLRPHAGYATPRPAKGPAFVITASPTKRLAQTVTSQA